MRKILTILSLILALLLGACAPQATAVPTSAPATLEPSNTQVDPPAATLAASSPAASAPAASTQASTPSAVGSPAASTPEAGATTGTPSASGQVPVTGGMVASISVADVGTLGQVPVDVNGKTLYIFKGDGQDSGKSSCTGDCLQSWAPLLTTGTPTGADGVDSSLLGTINRSTSGVIQVTYNGWPLYRSLEDNRPGQANGQSLDGQWFAIGVDGMPVTIAMPTATATLGTATTATP